MLVMKGRKNLNFYRSLPTHCILMITTTNPYEHEHINEL